MMRGFILFPLCFVAVAQGAPDKITVECKKNYGDFPSINPTSPSKLADLKVEVVTEGGNTMLNISWAISIDASVKYLKGTWIDVTDEPVYICTYFPPYANANLAGLKQEWFYFLIPAYPGHCTIEAFNIPKPSLGTDTGSLTTHITIHPPIEDNKDEDPRSVTTESAQTTMGSSPSVISTPEPTPLCLTVSDVTVIIFAVVGTLMILSSCYIMYKIWAYNTASSQGFENLLKNPSAAVPVLVVYPAVNSAFQGAVVALADFLQLHCGCTVAIDMWQQGKIAELGPMRWLAEQAKAAEHVLIVSPQPETSSSLLRHPVEHNLPEPSIPAAAHDLYPLILNMVASHAKNARELARFSVVQLTEEKDYRLLQLELRACRKFCLMKDLNKLCRCLHVHRHCRKNVIFRPGAFYSQKSTVKLREATERLRGNKPRIFKGMEPLKSMVSIV